MCLAALYLFAWEYDRLKPLIVFTREETPRRFRYQYVWIPLFFAIGGVVMSVLWWIIRLGNFSNYFNVGIALTLIGIVFGLFVSVHYRFMPVGRLLPTNDME